MPVEDKRLVITPLYVEQMVAILPASMRGIPKALTPDFVGEQFLVLEYGAVSALIRNWLSSASVRLTERLMTVSAVEAMKVVVAAGLGMSIVPAMAVTRPDDDIVIRPLDPPLTRTIALIQHRNKPDDLAFRIVRDAMMELSNIPARKQRKKARR
jgi:DNA-binding transcriptional LysR family regulator